MQEFLDFLTAVAEFLGISQLAAGLLIGAMLGSVIAGVAGRISFRMGVWRDTAAAAYQPQVAHTTRTPVQVVAASVRAQRRLGCARTIILLAFLTLGTGAVVYLLDLQDMAWGLALQLLGAFAP